MGLISKWDRFGFDLGSIFYQRFDWKHQKWDWCSRGIDYKFDNTNRSFGFFGNTYRHQNNVGVSHPTSGLIDKSSSILIIYSPNTQNILCVSPWLSEILKKYYSNYSCYEFLHNKLLSISLLKGITHYIKCHLMQTTLTI